MAYEDLVALSSRSGRPEDKGLRIAGPAAILMILCTFAVWGTYPIWKD